MTKQNMYSELTNEALLKKRALMKGVSIGFSIIYIFAIAILMYVYATAGFKNASIAVFIPFLIMPVTLLPLVINFVMLNKEIKSRNL